MMNQTRPPNSSAAPSQVFLLPHARAWEGSGVPPWSERRTLGRFTPRTRFRGESARLVACCLPVVTCRTERPKMFPRVWVCLPTRYQLASAEREMVGHIRGLAAQHTPRIGVQVRPPRALPLRGVDSATTRGAFPIRLSLVFLTTAPCRQLGASGYRAGGTGLTRHGGYCAAFWMRTWAASTGKPKATRIVPLTATRSLVKNTDLSTSSRVSVRTIVSRSAWLTP